LTHPLVFPLGGEEFQDLIGISLRFGVFLPSQGRCPKGRGV